VGSDAQCMTLAMMRAKKLIQIEEKIK